ncbi:ATP-dependent helicase HrpB [Desulfovibrio sp. UIB00]|uniref:ATP-dependent helicase HrpB n=1 Tax=Desulfovibrio sp. UIB00 TaxID=2804314 RepID=UPI001F10A6B5|nr:ATP-dependent helicase HrpB [Desulfovibrio sp. UIB00]MCH5144852.1 ATP-dependent helicase HrpB [Desulfovibrio sp. UIB00]
MTDLPIRIAAPSNTLACCPALPQCPLDASRAEVLESLAQGHNLVLSALPGAGKSSRVPLWLMGQSWLENRRILLLEPRRVAARALARYMAALLGEEPGGTVGYRMRDESRVSSRTCVEVVTEGVLTRMLQEDPELPDIACVIFDEFHERSLTADTGLALCLESQAALRPDLRLIVMSATLDVQAVATLMENCPSVVCEGKTFPVQMRHLPPKIRAGQIVGGPLPAAGAGPLLWRHMADVILHLLRTEQGSLLAFLPGAGEIRHLASLLEGALPADVALCPLYGNLSAREQDAAIAPAPQGHRKVVLATSIAETSLTIEGVRLVVDSGLARLTRFDPASGLTRLVTERVSLAGAAQRAGRAGRIEPGICCRLWAKEQENGMRPHIRAEILDADLTGLALQLAVWGVNDPASLAWLDTPPSAHLAVARQNLLALGAVDDQLRPTALGRSMAALPLAPRTARLLLWGRDKSLAALAACIAALLEERDPLAFAAGKGKGGMPAAGAGCDVLRRLDWLCRDNAAGKNADAARERVRRLAQRLMRQIDRHEEKGSRSAAQGQSNKTGNIFSAALALAASLGQLLAVAWPEQVAMRQTDGQPQSSNGNFAGGAAPMTPYLLRSGRAAQIASEDPLARLPFLAIAEVDGAAPRGRIRLAAALSPDDLAALFSADICNEDKLTVSDAGLVSARRQRVLGSLVLEDAPLPRPLPHQCAAALCAYVQNKGLECLPWDDAAKQWCARVSLLRELDGEAWPDVSDAALLATINDWLAPALQQALERSAGQGKQGRANSLAALGPEQLLDALRRLLPGNLHRILERQAPTEWQVPSGAMRPIVYGEDGGPWLAAKLQELFGCVDTPRIADGRVALVLRLNSPAGRPLQVTRDLAHFWRNGYPAVRAEMRGRYPKHPWPEDPVNAVATVLTKKRLAERQKS